MPTALRYIKMSPTVPSGLCKSLSCSLLYSISEADLVHADIPWLLQSISREQCLCRDHVCRHVVLFNDIAKLNFGVDFAGCASRSVSSGCCLQDGRCNLVSWLTLHDKGWTHAEGWTQVVVRHSDAALAPAQQMHAHTEDSS